MEPTSNNPITEQRVAPSYHANNDNSFWQRNAMILKGFFIAILTLLLLIPALFVSNLVNERKDRQREVKEEIFDKWATSQTITGPMIVIPYLYTYTPVGDKKSITERRQLILLPENLDIRTQLPFEERSRSIYKAIVYTSDNAIDGNFIPLNLKDYNIDKQDLLLKEATLCIGISDFKGICQQVNISFNGKQYELSAGSPLQETLGASLSTPIDLSNMPLETNPTTTQTPTLAFAYTLQLRGSEKIFYTPIGKTTHVSVASKWPHPDFQGNYLPKHEISDSGFTASWTVLHLNRAYPQVWDNKTYNIDQSSFGVNLLQPVDGYGKTQRTVKYALMIIALTFTIYFFLEIFQKRKMHALQYILVGIALCIFYTLLLSFSEYMNYNLSYAIAAIATILLLGLYTKSIFHSLKVGLLFGGFLLLLYGYIFTLIQLQDGALLVGSIGLFVVLAIIMYFSRKIEWNSYKQQVA